MAQDNADLYGSTVQFLYFPRVALVVGVTLNAAAEYFYESWDFDVVESALSEAVADESESVAVVIVKMLLEVGVVMAVKALLEVEVGDASGEVLVVD